MAAKKTRRKTPEPTLRHVWLAGLGLIAVARREAVGAANDALGKLQSARRQAEAMAGPAQRAEKTPGAPSRAAIDRPESSARATSPDSWAAWRAFNMALPAKVVSVSSGSGRFN